MRATGWMALVVLVLASSPAVAQPGRMGGVDRPRMGAGEIPPVEFRMPAGGRSPDARVADRGEIGSLSPPEYILSITALVFAATIAGLSAWMRVRQVIGGDMAFKLIGLAVVVGAGLFLIAAGYSNEQITGVVGLLGTGLGFIFGKNMASAKEEGS